jgi:hypothetical protein
MACFKAYFNVSTNIFLSSRTKTPKDGTFDRLDMLPHMFSGWKSNHLWSTGDSGIIRHSTKKAPEPLFHHHTLEAMINDEI